MYMEPATLYNARESRQEENPRILHNGVTPLISRNSSVVVSLSAWQWRFAMVWHRTGCSLGTVDRPHLGPNSCRDMGGHQDVLLHGQLLHISNTHWNACRILGQRLWTRGIRKNIRTLFVGYPYRLPESNDHQIQYQNPMTSLFILGTLQWEEGGNEICVTLKSIQNKMELTCYRFSWQFQPIRAVAVTESSPPRICSWVHTLSLIAAWPNRDKAQWFLKELNPMQLSPKSLVLFVRYWDMCATHWVKTSIILKSKLLLGSRNPSNNREYNPDSVEQSHIRSNLPQRIQLG